MRSVFILAVLLLIFGGVSAHLLDSKVKPGAAPPNEAAAVVPNAPAPPPGGAHGRLVEVKADARGHYRVDARVNGRPADFLVDTGATTIALNETSAARLGVRPAARDYTARVTTANGVVKAAAARLERVEIDGVVVRDVQAVVLPDEALSENLLGMSFLSRLRRFEIARGRLVLEQ